MLNKPELKIVQIALFSQKDQKRRPGFEPGKSRAATDRSNHCPTCASVSQINQTFKDLANNPSVEFIQLNK